MKLAKYKACICEGSAESAIIDILVDNNLLIFTREEMLDEGERSEAVDSGGGGNGITAERLS